MVEDNFMKKASSRRICPRDSWPLPRRCLPLSPIAVSRAALSVCRHHPSVPSFTHFPAGTWRRGRPIASIAQPLPHPTLALFLGTISGEDVLAMCLAAHRAWMSTSVGEVLRDVRYRPTLAEWANFGRTLCLPQTPGLSSSKINAHVILKNGNLAG